MISSISIITLLLLIIVVMLIIIVLSILVIITIMPLFGTPADSLNPVGLVQSSGNTKLTTKHLHHMASSTVAPRRAQTSFSVASQQAAARLLNKGGVRVARTWRQSE